MQYYISKYNWDFTVVIGPFSSTSPNIALSNFCGSPNWDKKHKLKDCGISPIPHIGNLGQKCLDANGKSHPFTTLILPLGH
jgi:hypothetical protein